MQFPLRGVSQESSTAFTGYDECNSWLSPFQGTEQFGVATNDRGRRLLQEQQSLNLPLKGNINKYNYYTTNNLWSDRKQVYLDTLELVTNISQVKRFILWGLQGRPMAFRRQEKAWSDNSKCIACQVAFTWEEPHDTTWYNVKCTMA